MPRLLTQEILNTMRCSSPDCDHSGHPGPLYLVGACHRGAALECYYDPDSGTLQMSCADCGAFVCQVLVAERARSMYSATAEKDMPVTSAVADAQVCYLCSEAEEIDIFDDVEAAT